jgi:hypothetical protein
MPGGSEYQGPSEALEPYRAAVEASSGDMAVRGAKNPYTSRNGHMFSFLDPEGSMALRLSDELAEEFGDTHTTGPVIQYGRTMRGYVSVPEELLADACTLATWLDRAYDWIGTLPPKSTTR